jgi:hypothetical protein
VCINRIDRQGLQYMPKRAAMSALVMPHLETRHNRREGEWNF